MKRSPGLVAIWISLSFAPIAESSNGSNYLHLTNGLDYFFDVGATSGAFRGAWQCFSGENLIAPTIVTDPTNPHVGTYAAKVCAIHISAAVSVGNTLLFPTIAISTGSGGCKFTQSGGTALNFGLVSSGIGNLVVTGPINQNPAGVALQVAIPNVTLPPLFQWSLVQLALFLTGNPGSPSSIPIPEGDSMTIWLQDNPIQPGPGLRQYWVASADERNYHSRRHIDRG